jgi:protocatechuate 3,4-dioxygenase beta subunit
MRLVAVILLAFAAGCGSSPKPVASKPAPATVTKCVPTAGQPADHISPAAAGTPSRVRLGPGMELPRTQATIAAGTGKPLVVAGVVRGQDCAPLAGATVNAWQANARGRYGPGRSCCYLQGTARTDRRGRYALETIVPGTYNGRPHIHLEVGHDSAVAILAELDVEGRPRRLRFDIVLPRR